ncbi:MAG: hypothetical protein KME25_06775 [Symplocastrum torsivum CPER-KK1]|jgi:hypothetical protein|uniref:Uncharacterized protein n=1 Tax=Symplocastrum torsivum CPER-KK1 TaxID=450513 RepID=A0A951PI58_9CYAN|nr:hypothetical protein [Symplocastrum torsivum CPER-KK1]
MDFIDEVRALAAKTTGLLEHIKTEAAVRTALVEPFIRALELLLLLMGLSIGSMLI